MQDKNAILLAYYEKNWTTDFEGGPQKIMLMTCADSRINVAPFILHDKNGVLSNKKFNNWKEFMEHVVPYVKKLTTDQELLEYLHESKQVIILKLNDVLEHHSRFVTENESVAQWLFQCINYPVKHTS
jgi:hypothetical protein